MGLNGEYRIAVGEELLNQPKFGGKARHGCRERCLAYLGGPPLRLGSGQGEAAVPQAHTTVSILLDIREMGRRGLPV